MAAPIKYLIGFFAFGYQLLQVSNSSAWFYFIEVQASYHNHLYSFLIQAVC
jgi:hypothetical protein